MSDRFKFLLTRRRMLMGVGAGFLLNPQRLLLAAAANPDIAVDPQPYFSQLRRIVEILKSLGEPLTPPDEAALLNLADAANAQAVAQAEKILARYTLLHFQVAERREGITRPGPAAFNLVEQGWRTFLVRVENPIGAKTKITLASDSGVPEGKLVGAEQRNNNSIEPMLPYEYSVDYPMQLPDIARRWMGYQFYSGPLMDERLSGLGVEYRIMMLFSRDSGKKSAYLQLLADETEQTMWLWLGRRRGFVANFDCLPSRDVVLDVADWDGQGCTASFLIKDEAGRIYPAPLHRLAPDFDFQPQVYRATGETVRLPPGRYMIETWRGPEYLRKSQTLVVSKTDTKPRFKVQLERWIDAARLGWYAGDTHIHASGCLHYVVPTRGVTPETIIRHVRGEGLAVGDILLWAPGYQYQKQFFSGQVYQPHNALEHPELQQANNTSLKPVAAPHDHDSLVRYDMEISGFPSSHAGHLVLLGLKDQHYPGANSVTDWPSWTLPILQWAKAQGAVTGFAHCGVGLATLDDSAGVSLRFVESTQLPNYEIPLFNGVGANEFLVDVTHDVVDFVSGTEMPPVTELNFWYHILNCGYRTSMVGETDFPCASDARVGNGRTYVGMDRPPVGEAGYRAWVDGIQRGRLYFGDGCSHFIDFQIEGCGVGGKDVELTGPATVTVKARVAARLEKERPTTRLPDIPAWNIEHAREGESRKVNLEVVVNGIPVANQLIEADGGMVDFSQSINIERSSWVALRILRTGHTHPIFVKVTGAPIRVSKRSAQWCLDCIDVLWKEKAPRIRDTEREAARQAYEHARKTYRKILSECQYD